METLKRTPLYDEHVLLGGKIVEFGGWELPVQYTSIIEEHKAVRERCGLFDVSHMGEVLVKGENAFDYLQHIVTNDISGMTPGRCRYSMVCYDNGGTVDDILIYMRGENDYFIVVNAANTDKDYDWFKSHETAGVSVTNVSSQYGQLALQGPLFMDVLAKLGLTADDVPAKNYTFKENVCVAGVNCIMSRTGYTGEDGVELYCAASDTTKLHRALMAAGKDSGLLPCGLGARDTLRFEASMPLYGHEMNAEITPVETGISFAVKPNKGDFIGREALLKAPEHMRIGLKLIDKGIAREHTDVYSGGKKVGHVTSGSPCPSLGGNYAMALVDIAAAEETEFYIDVRGRQLKAEKVALPFYKRAKK